MPYVRRGCCGEAGKAPGVGRWIRESGVRQVKTVGGGHPWQGRRRQLRCDSADVLHRNKFSTPKTPENSGAQNLVLYYLDLVFFLAQSEEGLS